MHEAVREITSEEKLLHIIESSEGQSKDNKCSRNDGDQTLWVSLLKNVGSSLLYKIIFWACLALVVVTSFYLLKKIAETAEFHNVDIKTPSGKISASEQIVPEKSYSSLSHLSLVGILWTDRPQAIIEDEKRQKTYLAYEGDMVNEYKIKKITQSQVEISYNGQDEILK